MTSPLPVLSGAVPFVRVCPRAERRTRRRSTGWTCRTAGCCGDARRGGRGGGRAVRADRGAGGVVPQEAPRSRVRVPAFLIARTQVAVGQRVPFARATGRPRPGPRRTSRSPASPGRRPPRTAALGARSGTPGRLRLPTEDEWERAARGRRRPRVPPGRHLPHRPRQPRRPRPRHHRAGRLVPRGREPVRRAGPRGQRRRGPLRPPPRRLRARPHRDRRRPPPGRRRGHALNPGHGRPRPA
ncbi:SUMF1/EgtB/PvdO family nonheme iron enzyme [Actinomadura keratinilytica]